MADNGKINEFTTDLDDPVEFRMVNKDTKFPEAFKETIRAEYPELKPLKITGRSLDDVFEAAVDAIAELPRLEVTHQEDKEGRIEGVYTTLFMRTKEDFTITIKRGSSEDEVVINMRTRSRSPGGLDGNERIMSFFKALQAELE